MKEKIDEIFKDIDEDTKFITCAFLAMCLGIENPLKEDSLNEPNADDSDD